MNSPQLNKALKYINDQLSTNDGDTPLPSIRTIAADCAVSLKTAYKAVALLTEKGVITCRWGYGIFSATATIPEKKIKPKKNTETNRNKTDRIKNALEKDLLNNTFTSGEKLPSLKALMARYNASYPTISKALQSLVARHLIQKSGTSYYIALNKPRWKLKIGVICPVNDNNELIIEKEREQNFFRLLFIEADRHNLQIETMGYRDWDSYPVFVHNSEEIATLPDDPDIAGYILVTWHMRDYVHCLNSICLCKKPVSVWLEHTPDIQDRKDLPGSCSIAFFDQSYSEQSGYDMGWFLLESGHNHIAYISPFHGSTWSQKRLAGLRSAFEEAGISDGITEYTDDKFVNDWSFMDTVLAGNEIETILDSNKLKTRFREFNSNKIDQILYNLNTLLRDHLIYKQSTELFEKAFSDRANTAWVAANDLCSFLCLDFLKKNGITVPHNISLAGFDNTFQSLKLGITSYDFNTPGLVHSMIDFILNPSEEIYKKSRKVVHLSGKVIARGSVKKTDNYLKKP